MGSQNPRTYTAEEKQRIIARAAEVGPAQTSAETGIPKGTVSFWTFDAKRRKVAVPPEPPTYGAESGTTVTEVSAPSAAGAASPRTRRPRVAKVYTPTQVAQALERMAAIGLRPAEKELGISRTTLRDWERKAAKAERGEGVAPTSGPDPRTVEARRDSAILAEWRKQQGLGPSQIRNQLRRAGTKVSVQTVRRVMEEAGYRPPKVERHDHTGSYEAVCENRPIVIGEIGAS